MDAPNLPDPQKLTWIAGPLIMGYFFDWGLFGVLFMQVYQYYLGSLKDSLNMKMIVYGLFAFQIAQTVLLTESAFNIFAVGFGNVDLIHDTHHLWFSVPIMTSTVTLVVQTLYAFRIYELSKSLLLPGIIVLLSVTQLGGGFAEGVFSRDADDIQNFSDFRLKEAVAAGVWNGAAALADIIMASCMIFYSMKPTSKFKVENNTRSPRSILLFIHSGAALAVIAIINAILFQLPGSPRPTYFQTTAGMLSNAYTITLMSLLNSRTSTPDPPLTSARDVISLPRRRRRMPSERRTMPTKPTNTDALSTEMGYTTGGA